MKKSYTIGRTPQELRTAVEILIRNDFFELENISVKHDDTEGHAFALILKGDTFQDTVFMDIISGEQTTLTYTYSCEDAAIPARLSQLNQKLSEVLDAAEYKDEIEGETPKQPVPEAEPKPEKTSDQSAAKPAVHDYHKWSCSHCGSLPEPCSSSASSWPSRAQAISLMILLIHSSMMIIHGLSRPLMHISSLIRCLSGSSAPRSSLCSQRSMASCQNALIKSLSDNTAPYDLTIMRGFYPARCDVFQRFFSMIWMRGQSFLLLMIMLRQSKCRDGSACIICAKYPSSFFPSAWPG